MASRTVPGHGADDFDRALRDLHAVRLRPEVRLTEVPAPTRIAPHAVAMTADVLAGGHPDRATPHGPDEEHDAEDDEVAAGRFVLLHDPSAPEPWGGQWRVVTFARAELEPELAGDPLLGEVGWSWLTDALAAHGLDVRHEAGTVTRVVSESFADLADREPTVEMEIRASWTPTGDDAGGHLRAWADMLCTIGGLLPLPDGVVALPGRRR